MIAALPAKKTRRTYPVVCHPGKPSSARGLCVSCYRYWSKIKRTSPHSADERFLRLQNIVDGHEDRKAAAAIEWHRQDVATKRQAPGFKFRSRSRTIEHRYGITLEQKIEMYKSQNGQCAICKRSDKPLYVDHCHATRVVRGLLCPKCNNMMSVIDAGPEVIKDLLVYAAKTKGLEWAESVVKALKEAKS